MRQRKDSTFDAISRRKVMMAGGVAVALAGLRTKPARAVLQLDVTRGNVQPMPIAIPDFIAGTPGEVEMARTVTQVITNNLGRSGLFAPIDRPPTSSGSPTSTRCRALPT